jgi:tight adherence protein C
MAGLAAFAPERALARRAAARRRRMTRALPEVLDLLAICVEGGMALDPALAVATEHAGGPLGDELAAARADIALGMPRRAAYAGLAERCGVPEVAQAVGALVQAEELGAPLSPALAAQAEATREAARRAALDRAAKAGPRIQLVVATVLVPAALILIVGAFAIELTSQVGAVIDAP